MPRSPARPVARPVEPTGVTRGMLRSSWPSAVLSSACELMPSFTKTVSAYGLKDAYGLKEEHALLPGAD